MKTDILSDMFSIKMDLSVKIIYDYRFTPQIFFWKNYLHMI